MIIHLLQDYAAQTVCVKVIPVGRITDTGGTVGGTVGVIEPVRLIDVLALVAE
jgi:hypothetical protein